jgi:hypothetical protein
MNRQFQFFENKISNKWTVSSGYFKTLKEPIDFHERTHDSLTFNFFHKPWLYTIIGDLKLLITGW